MRLRVCHFLYCKTKRLDCIWFLTATPHLFSRCSANIKPIIFPPCLQVVTLSLFFLLMQFYRFIYASIHKAYAYLLRTFTNKENPWAIVKHKIYIQSNVMITLLRSIIGDISHVLPLIYYKHSEISGTPERCWYTHLPQLREIEQPNVAHKYQLNQVLVCSKTHPGHSDVDHIITWWSLH